MQLRSILPLMLALACAPARGQGAADDMRKGSESLAAGLWEIAAFHYERSLHDSKLETEQSARAAIGLAEAWIRAGKAAEALDLLEQSVARKHPEQPFWKGQALAASGLLVAKVGGRPVRPYQPQGIWEDVAMKESTTRFYRTDSGENLYRRSLYTLIKRTALAPAMDILNAPNREVSCVRRDRTNTPLQALVTLNDPLFVEASRQLAARAVDAAPAFDARLDLVSLRLLGRTFS